MGGDALAAQPDRSSPPELPSEPGGAAPSEDVNLTGSSYPVRISERPLTIPQGALNADFSLSADRVASGFYAATDDRLFLGAAYGITDDWEVRAGFPVSFGVGGHGGIDMTVGATYRLMSVTEIVLGLQLDLQIPFTDQFRLAAGVPMHFHMGVMRIRTRPEFTLSLAPGNSLTAIGLNLPVAFDVSWLANMPVSLSTGFRVINFSSFQWAIPIGIELGWTMGTERPIVDLLGIFEFPELVSADGIISGVWIVGVRARVYIL
jgi:hypothetical protein